MNKTSLQRVYEMFFSLFIIVGLGLLIFGFVKLTIYKLAKEIDATVISTDCNYEKRKMKVLFEFESNGKYFTTSEYFDIKYENGQLLYYEGLQTKIHISNNNQIVTYGKKEIIVTIGGGLFFLSGIIFLYYFILQKRNLFDIAYDYEKAMVNPNDISDDTAKIEALADEMSKLPTYHVNRMVCETKIWKNRLSNRLRSFTIAENIIFSLILLGLIVLFWTVFQLGVFGIFFGLFTFAFGGLLLKSLYGIYIKFLVKLGRFSEKKIAIVNLCVFESEGSFQTGNLSCNHIVFKKFRVVATIEKKRSIGYVYGNVAPPANCVLKVLVRPHKLGRFIVDNT